LICPHCRFETPSSPCEHCGWESLRAYVWAAQQAEGDGRLDRAIDHWRSALRLSEGEEGIARSALPVFVRKANHSTDEALFKEVASLLDQILRSDPTWEAGRQAQVLLYDHFGQNEELLRRYESEGENAARWAEQVRLMIRFRGEGKPEVPASKFGGRKVWVLRLVLFVGGLGLTLQGSAWLRPSPIDRSVPILPVMVFIFGLSLSAGSMLLYWRDENKRTKAP